MGRLILVTGGSGSGKSSFAEKALLGLSGGRAVYLATMERSGSESLARIQRHRAMRARHGEAAGRQFHTVERSTAIGGAELLPGDAVLIEDLGNLLANEIWSPQGAGEKAAQAVISGVLELAEKADLVVAVTNQIGADGGDYPEETRRYIRDLGRVNSALAGCAHAAVEVVCGIPLFLKGRELFSEIVPVYKAHM